MSGVDMFRVFLSGKVMDKVFKCVCVVLAVLYTALTPLLTTPPYSTYITHHYTKLMLT